MGKGMTAPVILRTTQVIFPGQHKLFFQDIIRISHRNIKCLFHNRDSRNESNSSKDGLQEEDRH